MAHAAHHSPVAYYKIVIVGGDRGHEAPRQVLVPQEQRVATWLAFRRGELRALARRLGVTTATAIYRDGSSGQVAA